MVYGSPGQVLEHGTTSTGRWLRARRVRVAIWAAVAEGLLVVLHVIPWLLALVIAAGVVAFYVAFGRQVRSYTVRQVSWIGAASQALMIAVPLILVVLGWVAILALALLAVVAVVALFSDRR